MSPGCSDYALAPQEKLPDAEDTSLAYVDTALDPDCREHEVAEPAEPTVDATCLRTPEVGTFTPVVEWQWDTDSVWGVYNQVMMTPVVGQLTDDDGDGDIDEDDVPDIAFTSYAGSAYSSAGALNVISGDGSGTHWSVVSPGGHTVIGTGGVALGDLEGDGAPEVCVAGGAVSVICLNGQTGGFKWAGTGSRSGSYGFPSIADMNGDGDAEVIMGAAVFNSAGALVGEGTGGYGGGAYGLSIAVDMDDDGVLEVVVGNAVYEMDGTTLWSDGGADGIPAVGDFDADGFPEVVRVAGGRVILADTDGTTLWQTTIPGSGSGGPPTVADFDGDGSPEVGVANLSYYSLFDTDGTVLWSNPTEDDSSSVTGSSVFDFEGDGAAEVVYADEHSLYIYDGATGAILLEADGHASGTLWEYPVIADVDGDDSTEIVVGSNNMWWSGWTGITVIGDEGSTWAPARKVWNQHAYHISNVNNDSSIPAVQTNNWLSWNNFRAGGTELGPSHWLADLRPADPDLCLMECGLDRVILHLAVDNAGLIPARPFTLELVAADGASETVLVSETVAGLGSGSAAQLGPYVIEAADWGTGVLLMRVDTSDGIEECDEDDNEAVLGGWPCP